MEESFDKDVSFSNNNNISKSVPQSPKLNRSSDLESRQKYYKLIVKKGDFTKTFLETPKHVLNPNIFYVSPLYTSAQDVGEQSDGFDLQKTTKAKSWMTIVSIWNTMIGSTLVSLPWAVRKAGIIPTIVLCLLYSLIMFYTSYVIVKTGKNDNDYSDTVHRYFGSRWGYIGRVTQIIFANLINLGAIFIFFLIINQNLFPVLGFFINLFGAEIDLESGVPYFTSFSIFYCAIIVCTFLYPLINAKEMTFIMKINSYGIYFSVLLMGFVVYNFIYSLTDTNFDFQYIVNTEADKTRHLYLFGENPLQLAGTLSMGLFCHSFILPIMKNNEKPENNRRDLFIGYTLVCFTYMIIGIFGYIGFSGINFTPEIVTTTDIFGTFYGDIYPSKRIVYFFNFMILLFSLLVLYLCYDLLGKMMGIIGTLTGLFLVYIIPISINIIYRLRKQPYIAQNILNESSDHEKTFDTLHHNKILNVTSVTSSDYTTDSRTLPKVKAPMRLKDRLFYIANYLLLIVGVFNLVTQFVYINVFGITFS